MIKKVFKVKTKRFFTFSQFSSFNKKQQGRHQKNLEINILLLNKLCPKMRLIYCTTQVLDTFYLNIRHKLSSYIEKKRQ